MLGHLSQVLIEYSLQHHRHPPGLDRLPVDGQVQPSLRNLPLQEPHQGGAVPASVEMEEEEAGHGIVELENPAALAGDEEACPGLTAGERGGPWKESGKLLPCASTSISVA
ncbi:MAG: hypothetical protein QOH06_5427 [Acidobacteriota bacterium]|nr:hypothetical protein [Acidobacteriota bacterium]